MLWIKNPRTRIYIAAVTTAVLPLLLLLLLLLVLLLLPLLLLLILMPNILCNAITFDSTSEHNFHFHHVRLNLRAWRSVPLRSTQHLSDLRSTTFTCCNTTVPKAYLTPQIAFNNEKCSYCLCCIIGDFFRRRFGDRWLSRECPLAMTTFFDKK